MAPTPTDEDPSKKGSNGKRPMAEGDGESDQSEKTSRTGNDDSSSPPPSPTTDFSKLSDTASNLVPDLLSKSIDEDPNVSRVNGKHELNGLCFENTSPKHDEFFNKWEHKTNDIASLIAAKLGNEILDSDKNSYDNSGPDLGSPENRVLGQGLTNLVTILEGEVLEIPAEAQTPHISDLTPRTKFSYGVLQSDLREDDKDGQRSRKISEADYDGCYDDDDDGSVISLPAELPPPPDGGWGWVIVFVSFLANMIVDGTAYSFSPFLPVFSEYFQESNGKVAWISSLLAGVYLSAGPIVSSLVNKYGCRPVCIIGAIIGSLAYASTVFANSVVYLMITQGVCAGFGFGFIYLPAVVCVGYYFERKRALATGIAVCGSGVGTMIFPPLVNLLIETYGWKGANLIIAGLILNCCWMGALMRPLEVPKMKRKDLLHRLAEEKKLNMEMGSLSGSNYFTITHSDGTVERKIKPGRSLNPDPGVHSHLNLAGLSPVGTSLALPTIQEGVNTSEVAEALEEKCKPLIMPAAAPHGDEKDYLVRKVSSQSANAAVVGTRSPSGVTKMPRNRSQPAMHRNGSSVPKIGSVPNFERRLSKMELFSHLKVVPATTEASYLNLRALGSQDMRRPSTDSEAGALRRRLSKDRGIMLPPMARQDIFYSGSIKRLNEFKSQASMLSYRESTYNLQNTAASRTVLSVLDFAEDEAVDGKQKKCCPEDLCAPLKGMMDFSLMKNPVFLLIGFANMIGMLGFYTPFVYLPLAAMEKGVDKDSAMLLVSIIGVTNTIGRVLSGLIADIPSVNALWVNNISIILSGLCVFLTPFAYSFGAFVTIAVFFGFFVSPYIALCSIILVDLFGLKFLTQTFGLLCFFRGVAGTIGPPAAAAYISLTSIILVELLGLSNLTNSFGLLILFRGSASMVGPPFAGSIYDATQSYDVSFYSSGALLFLCAFMHCIIPCVQRCTAHESPVRYHTNEDYLQSIPEEDVDERSGGGHSPDVGEGIGIVFDVKRRFSGPRRSSSGSGEAEKNKEPTNV